MSRDAARGAAGAAGGADLRAGRAPDRGDVPVPAAGRRLRRAAGLGVVGPAVVLGVAGVEVPAGAGHRPRAGPRRPRPAGPAGDPGRVRRRAAVVCQGAGADPDRHPGHRGGPGRAGRADDRRPAGAVRPRAPPGVPRLRPARPGRAAGDLAGGRRGRVAGDDGPPARRPGPGADPGAARRRRRPGPPPPPRLRRRFRGNAGPSRTAAAQASHPDAGAPPGGNPEADVPEAAGLAASARGGRSACEQPGDERPGSGGPEAGSPQAASLADALAGIAADYLAGKIAAAANPDLYQVIVHVGPEALA